MMPEMGGDELVAALRQRPDFSTVPIVVLTAKADDAFVSRLLRSGAQDYVIKPFMEEELRARVANLIAAKLAEEALRLAEAKSRASSPSRPTRIISIDDDQRITMFNEGAEKIFGYSKAEAIGAPLDILIPERFRAVHRHHVERFAAGQRDRAPDGRARSRRSSACARTARSFPPTRPSRSSTSAASESSRWSLRDITEQKRIEREQRFLAEVGSALATTLDYEETLSSIAELAVRELADLCIVDVVEDDGEVRRLKVLSRDPSKASALPTRSMRDAARSTRPHLAASALEDEEARPAASR